MILDSMLVRSLVAVAVGATLIAAGFLLDPLRLLDRICLRRV